MWYHPGTACALAEALEVPPGQVATLMGNDVCQTWIGNNFPMEGIQHEHDGERHTDAWGLVWERQNGFNQIVSYPLAGGSDEALAQYTLPHGSIPELLRSMEALAPFRATHFIGCDISPCVFELLTRLFGMEEAMLRLAEGGMEAFLDRVTDFSVALAEAGCRQCRPDWLWTGDDIGGQQGMMLSPEMWRGMVRARMRRVVEVGRRHGIPVVYHSCGAVRPVIPDLIAMGVDVLNPIQCDCPGMEPASLKAEFGKHLAFMGGVDTITLLPRGSVAQVRRVTRALIDAMTADGGGYILAASHTVAPETPMDNIFAMLHEAGLSREMIFDAAATWRSTHKGDA